MNQNSQQPQQPQQTVLRGIVRKSTNRGVTYGGVFFGAMDSRLDRTKFRIEMIDGSDELFGEWITTIGFPCIAQVGDSMLFCEIGPAPWKIQDGTVIELTYEQYVTARLALMVCHAANQIRYRSHQARMLLQQR